MRKYFFIYKSELMSTLSYALNILSRLIGYIMMIYIFINLWDYIYDDPSKLINEYSKSQMIWYVIVTEIIWISTDSRRLCRRISDDVKGGNIAYNMNKPYSYIGYAISSHLGETTIKSIITILVGLVMGLIFLDWFPALDLAKFLIIALSFMLAILISSFIVTFIGLISFIIEDSNPIHWLYSKMILVLGALFPVEFFPGVLANFIKVSPIYVICYGPAKLFVDFSYERAVEILLAQVIYLGFSSMLCIMLYKKGVKKLNVTGG